MRSSALAGLGEPGLDRIDGSLNLWPRDPQGDHHGIVSAIAILYVGKPVIHADDRTIRSGRHVAIRKSVRDVRALPIKPPKWVPQASQTCFRLRPGVIRDEPRQALLTEIAQMQSSVERMKPRPRKGRRIPDVMEIRRGDQHVCLA